MKNPFPAFAAVLALFCSPVAASDTAATAPAPAEPVVLINTFVVPQGKVVEAIRFWERAADFMRTQPGYISTTLHQAILPDARYELINVAQWESAKAFSDASQALREEGGLKPVDGVIPGPSLYTVIRAD